MNKIFKKVNGAYRLVASLFLLTLFLSVFIQIIMRNFFDAGSIKLEEWARFSLVSLVFLYLPVLVVEKKHIVVDVVTMHLPKAVDRWLSVVTDALCTIFSIYVLFGIAAIMERNWSVKTPALEMPNVVFYIPITFGIVYMVFATLVKALFTALGKEVKV